MKLIKIGDYCINGDYVTMISCEIRHVEVREPYVIALTLVNASSSDEDWLITFRDELERDEKYLELLDFLVSDEKFIWRLK